jgi:hypothetical protein
VATEAGYEAAKPDVLRRVKGGARRAQEVEKSLQGDRFARSRGSRVYPPALTLDPWWTRRERPRIDAARQAGAPRAGQPA